MTTHADRIRQMGEQADEMAAAALGVGTYERWSDEFASKRDAALAQLVAEDCENLVMQAAKDNPVLGASACNGAAGAIRARYSLKD